MPPAPIREARKIAAALSDGRPVSAHRVVKVASALRARGRDRLARQLVESALDRLPRAAELWAAYAEIAASAGRSSNAVVRYRKAIQLTEQPPAKWFTRLAEELLSAGAPDSEVDAAHEAAIRARPSNEGPVNAWVLALQSRGLDEATRDQELVRLQVSSREPLPALLFFLLAKGLTGTVPAGLEAHVARFMASDSAAACRGVWEAYCSLRPLDRQLCRVVSSLPVA